MRFVKIGFLVFVMATFAHAIRIEIKNGVVKPEPIAIPYLFDDSGSDLAKDISEVVSSDLVSSGLFTLVDRKAYIQSPESLKQNGAQLSEWRVINARFLFSGSMETSGSTVTVSFKLYDVFSGKTIGGIELSGSKEKWRRIAHMISDYIYNRITSEDGFFNTQVAYVESVGTKGRSMTSRIMRMDRDGANVESISDGKSLSFGPRYSPDGKSIVYYVLPDKKPAEIYVMDVESRQRRILGQFAGLRIAPRFSPSSKKIIFSLSKNGTSAIYTQDLHSNTLSALTEHFAIDTSPCYDPTGDKIIFTSDRGGKPQLYTMDADGGNQVRISYGDGSYFQPAWSPRGDLIAFTKQKSGQFFIGVIRPDGSDERLIASGYMLESPVWSPNGRYLMFTRQASRMEKSKIVFIDLTGHNMQEIATPKDASDPAWSPLLGSAIVK